MNTEQGEALARAAWPVYVPFDFTRVSNPDPDKVREEIAQEAHVLRILNLHTLEGCTVRPVHIPHHERSTVRT